ncbi:phosphate/phosphite/phosphonate ABC transporter substrate-binding protein [Hydrogenivirga sp. 128-5-R1-1]|uniref:phosphate/phosphite/phosphonate ABC transporter substrate-binding protein n=1 Tax=Hydrogenivirga sp. 128-5-R1-1 TaxID=392423 RepID=UPI00015F04AF|nr:phosphate/phosphite/phosphonate ABC transporter substrate-binding protein [Hydrogenivirga sp. 128-5-R1-1]EDP73791.1 phosphate-binding protein of phosphonate ABC transporter [Hydrogenivirga sp. 128-5-R1-1]
MVKRLLSSFLALFLFVIFSYAKDFYNFAVLSGENPVIEYKRYKALSNYISQKLHKPVKLRIIKNVDKFLDFYEKGLIDISIACPVVFYEIKEKYGAKSLALLKINNEILEAGVWVVRKDSNIKEIKDLKGKRITLGSSICASNCVMPLFVLSKEGITYKDIPDMWSSGTDKAAILNVLAGLADAAGVKEESAKKYLDKGIRIISKSPYVPRYVVSVSRKLSKEDIKALKNVLFSLKDKKLLKNIGIDGFVEVPDFMFEIIKNYKDILNQYPLLQ